jgi:hypothetical protein
MAQLKTRNVFVDTEFFDSIKLNLRSKTAIALRGHAEQGRIRLFLTTITVGEIKRHLRDCVNQAAASLKNIRALWAFLGSVKSHPLKVLFEKVDKKKLFELLEGEFDSYLEESNAEILDVSSANAVPIFEAYFKLRPPFQEGNKKYEFPDAFAIQVLENWCESKHEKMYVVTKDKGWEAACAENKHLIYIDAVDKILDSVTKDQEAEIAERALAYFNNEEANVEREIRKSFVDRGFYVEGEDGEVTEIVVKDIDLGEPSVISISESETVLSAEATITFEAEVTINDVNSGYFDKEDSKWIYLPTRSGTVERQEHPRVIVTLDYDPDDEHFYGFSVDLEGVSETVYVSADQWDSWPIDDDSDDTEID